MGGSTSSENTYSVAIENAPPAGRSAIYRSGFDPLMDIVRYETFAQAFDAMTVEGPNRPFLGTRE